MSDDNNLPNFGELLQSAQRMQQEMARIQSELGQKNVEGSSGGGLVKAVANGRQQLVSLSIERDIVDLEDLSMLEDLVVAAVNQALARASELAKDELSQVAGGLPLKIPRMM